MTQASILPVTPSPKPNEFNLIWLDMEMTGLDPDNDRIIEVAVLVTDMELNVLAEGPVFDDAGIPHRRMFKRLS